MNGAILAVDPGEARIGLAISDPTRTIARPLSVLRHQARAADAEKIAGIARELDAVFILVGLALDDQGAIGPQARKALRLVEALRLATDIPVGTWDESGSTRAATRRSRDPQLDARAAAYFLQEYLDANPVQ